MPQENFNGEVNSEDFWDTVSMEMISFGFLKSMFIMCTSGDKYFSNLRKRENGSIHIFVTI